MLLMDVVTLALQLNSDYKRMLLPLLRTIVIFLLIDFDGNGEAVPLSEKCRAHVKRLIEVWMQNPVLFPNRVSGSMIYNTCDQNDPTHVPDIILWDPMTQYKLELTCPHCSKIDICIQRPVVLVSRVYRCTAGHQVLAHDPWLLQIISSSTEVPLSSSIGVG